MSFSSLATHISTCGAGDSDAAHISTCGAGDSDDDFDPPPPPRFRQSSSRADCNSVPLSSQAESDVFQDHSPACTLLEESDPSLPPPSNPHASVSPYQNLPGPSSGQSPVIIDSDSSEDVPSRGGKKDVLYEMFINSREKVDSMLELCSDDVNLACQVLVEECNCRTILLMRSKRMAKIQRRNIHINTENFLHDALSIYKDFSSFDVSVPLVVQYEGQRAMDVGGVRRSFFTTLLNELKINSTLGLFEGGPNALLPACNNQAIVCGHFKMLGVIIVHSVMQEGPAFPYFPPSLYWYMCTGSIEKSIQFLSISDLPCCSKSAVDKVI